MKVLVSGGAGFIGSHTCIELLNEGYDVAVFDNFVNSSPETVQLIEKITGKKCEFYRCDMNDRQALENIFKSDKFDALIHFAGLKAVGESVEKPLLYYYNNVVGSINLFDLCQKYNVNKIVFSSSATVYGNAEKMPIKEDYPLSVTNPYGRTKLILEQILSDIAASNKEMAIILLRYFNPAGAHESYLIGENPLGIPNNIMPKLVGAAAHSDEVLKVFGNDYPTRDGTCVRDYIHIKDLAAGHLCALRYIEKDFRGIDAFNLGRGEGVTVKELIETFERVNGVRLSYEYTDRRAGDVPESYADVAKANKLLGFKAVKSVEDICRDSWNYYINKVKGNGQ